MRLIGLIVSHGLALAAGFAAGIYALPLLTAPDAPARDAVAAVAEAAAYEATFERELPGSDFLHWGEGTVSVAPNAVALMGRLAPGPDYRLYLAHGDVPDGEAFLAVKDRALHLGAVRTFDNFVVAPAVPADVDAYDSVVVWCESFGQFITSARYR